jgi:Tetratricopeptide repeat
MSPRQETLPPTSSDNNFGISLTGVGEHRKALTAIGESVGLYRELVKAQPARDTLGLAASLTNLGVSLAKLGEHWKALTAFEEACGCAES